MGFIWYLSQCGNLSLGWLPWFEAIYPVPQAKEQAAETACED